MKRKILYSLMLMSLLTFLPFLTEVKVKAESIHINRISQFKEDNEKLSIDGYSYVSGVNIPNKGDIIQKLKFVDSKSGKQVLTFELPNYYSTAASKDPNHGAGIYNYDWAKFKGNIDISSLPIGEYSIKIYTNAKGYKFDEIIKFHSSIGDFSFTTNGKQYEFSREGNTLRLKVIAKAVPPVTEEKLHVNRISYFKEENGKMYVDGYSYVKGINIPNKTDIIQKLKFVDSSTGKQVKTYELPNFYSTAASKDPNHGAGIYNYDWAKFKGYLDVSDLPIGEYYIKIYTNAKKNSYDEIIAFHSSIKSFDFTVQDKLFNFEKTTVNNVGTLKLTVKDVKDENNTVVTVSDLFDDMIMTLVTRHGYGYNYNIGAITAESPDWGLSVGSYIYRGDREPDYGITIDRDSTEADKNMLMMVLQWIFPADADQVYNEIDFNFTDSKIQHYNINGLEFTIEHFINMYNETIQYIRITFLDQEIINYPIKEANRTGNEILNRLVNEFGWEFSSDTVVHNDGNLMLQMKSGPISGEDMRLRVYYTWLSEEEKEQIRKLITWILPNEYEKMIDYMDSDAFWDTYFNGKSYEFDNRIIGQYYLAGLYELYELTFSGFRK